MFILDFMDEAPIQIPRLTVQDWTLLQARLIWCYEGEVEARYRSEWSRRRHLSAWCMLAGRATVRRGRKAWSAGPGEWLFAGPESFQQEFSDDARILSVNFQLEWPSGDSLVTQPLVVAGAAHPELTRSARKLVRFIRRMFPAAHVDLWRQPAGLEEFFGLQQLMSGWVLAYLRAVLREGVVPTRIRGTDSRIMEVVRRLDRHPWAETLDEKKIAAEAGMSPRHLDRLFGREVGTTPRAYLQKRRLEAALAALSDRTLPVKKVAYDLGFGSASHFCHWLKKATGNSPRALRAKQPGGSETGDARSLNPR